MDGSAVSCAGIEGGRTCTFDVEFRIEGLNEPARAQLVVEITQAADGSDFSGTLPQANLLTLTPDGTSLTGTLTGGPSTPVTELVRFNLFIEVLDSEGDVIASSDTVSDLRPQ